MHINSIKKIRNLLGIAFVVGCFGFFLGKIMLNDYSVTLPPIETPREGETVFSSEPTDEVEIDHPLSVDIALWVSIPERCRNPV